MSAPAPWRRGPLLVGLVLAAGLALQTVQTVRVTRQVLNPEPPSALAPAAKDRLSRQVDEARQRRETVILTAVPGRDPFRAAPDTARPAPAPVADSAPAPTPPRPRPAPAPVLKALMDDNVQPAIQVAVGRKRSGWLTRNQSFEGWTVTDIRPGKATLARGSRRVELSLD